MLVITGDEGGDWGLVRKGKYYGLHGPGNLLPSNVTSPLKHILMPGYAKPWFRQYYDVRQEQAFGTDFRCGHDTTPAINVTTPAINVTTPAINDTTPAINVTTPAINVTTPAINNTTPVINVTTPAINDIGDTILF